MKIRVLFFASLREAVGIDALELTLDRGDFDALQRALVAALAERADALWEDNVRLSRNQQLLESPGAVEFSEGDELAFLPPVTGG